jgi:dTDP-glucose pyrophosphorylase
MSAAPDEITKAVILARGLGKRMRDSDSSASLAAEQSRVANARIKAMIPVGRPFLDFVLSALADGGFTEACLVVGPEHSVIRDYYASAPLHRIKVSFAIQEHAIGTANALLAAQSFTAGESFISLNSDNFYPVEAFSELRALGEPGLAAFEREALICGGNIPPDRVRGYALLRINPEGYLEQIVEKPDDMRGATAGNEVFISMNCWRFSSVIFRACEQVPRSGRGEFELSEAVQFGMGSIGLRFKAIPFHAGVLDLSYRCDIPEIAKRLAGVRVEL